MSHSRWINSYVFKEGSNERRIELKTNTNRDIQIDDIYDIKYRAQPQKMCNNRPEDLSDNASVKTCHEGSDSRMEERSLESYKNGGIRKYDMLCSRTERQSNSYVGWNCPKATRK